MKHALPYLYLFAPTLTALAHGGEDDGHVDTPAAPDPESRVYVMAAVGVVLVLMIAWFVWAKMKAAPPKENPPADPAPK